MIRLTEWTSCGGCAAKWGAAPLVRARCASSRRRRRSGACWSAWRRSTTPPSTGSATTSPWCRTTDFFPPLVDDPADFGAIAAANACSDVFAMGGRVVMALNISAFPERMPLEAIGAILVGRGRGRARGGRRASPAGTPSAVRGADLRPRRAGARAPDDDLHESRRPARRRARAVEAARHGHRARRAGRPSRRRRPITRHAHAEPGGVRGAV